MMHMKLNPLLIIGISGAFIWGLFFGIQLYSAYWGNQNIYWTARTMPLQIDETKESFELFIGGKSIHEHLSDKTLLVENEGHQHIVSSADIKVRLNNWSRVKSSFLTHALWSGMMFSAFLTLFLVGLFQALMVKNGSRQKSAGTDGLIPSEKH